MNAASLPGGTVTFLLTDVEGSTRIWQRDAGAAVAAMARHEEIVVEAIALHGGGRPVEQGEGDSVVVAFGRARDALGCAVSLQLALQAERWPPGAALRVRMSLHTGEAELVDDNYRGSALNRAARLRSLAHGGQVLLSATTADLVRDALPAGVTLLDLGDHPLKDFARPEHVFQLAHAGLLSEFPPLHAAAVDPDSSAAWSVPLPAAFASGEAQDELSVFVGRARELEELSNRLEKLRPGRAEVVMVSGEAGIGKTQLCSHFARAAQDGGALVLYGRSDEDLGIPYQPWVEVLSHLVTHMPAHLIARHGGVELARLVPAVRHALPDLPAPTSSDPETQRYLLFGAVSELLTGASQHAPVLVVLDDLHWADKPTLMLLRHLVTATTAAQVLVLATFRDTDVARGDPLSEVLAALRRVPNVERLTLRGLDDLELVSLLEAAAGHDMDGAGVSLAHALHRETEGNPFFANEIVRNLAETGAIVQDENGRWVPTAELDLGHLPASVREVVGQRVARLGEDAQRVLTTAAVIGRDFDLDLLARVTERGDDDLLDVLEEAVGAAVIAESSERGEQFSFVHALIQRTLYEELGATRRGRVHRRIAEALEDLTPETNGERVGELAHHWAAATAPMQSDKAVEYARLAGDRALAQLAPDEAVRFYTQGIELLAGKSVGSSAQGSLLARLGEAQRQIGDPAYRQTLLDAAKNARIRGDTDLLVRAALSNSRGGGMESAAGVIDTERVGVLEAALDAIDESAPDLRAKLLATLATELEYSADPARRIALADEALEIAHAADDPATLVFVLNHRHEALRLPQFLDDRLVTTAEAMALAAEVGNPMASLHAARLRLYTQIEGGERSDRERCLEIIETIAREVGQPLLRWINSWIGSACVLLDGFPEESERLATDALEIGTESGEPDAFEYYGAAVLNARIHQGRLDELFELLADEVEQNPGLPVFRGALAMGYANYDRVDEAHALLATATANQFADHNPDEMWLMGMALWGLTAARLGAIEPAALLHERLLPWSGQIPSGVAAIIEPVDHVLGELGVVLGRFDEADAHFSAAEQLSRRLACPYFISRAQAEHASMLVDRDPVRARTLADQAHTVARDHGFALVEQRAAEILEQLA